MLSYPFVSYIIPQKYVIKNDKDPEGFLSLEMLGYTGFPDATA